MRIKTWQILNFSCLFCGWKDFNNNIFSFWRKKLFIFETIRDQYSYDWYFVFLTVEPSKMVAETGDVIHLQQSDVTFSLTINCITDEGDIVTGKLFYVVFKWKSLIPCTIFIVDVSSKRKLKPLYFILFSLIYVTLSLSKWIEFNPLTANGHWKFDIFYGPGHLGAPQPMHQGAA